jgi:transcriptional regulator with XRE-family HTH domain
MVNPASELRKRLTKERLTQAGLAERLNVSETNVSLVLSGQRAPGPAILKYLGLKRVVGVRYERINGRME